MKKLKGRKVGKLAVLVLLFSLFLLIPLFSSLFNVFAQEGGQLLRIKPHPSEPANVEIISLPDIVADGKTFGEIQIKIVDKYGNAVADGTQVIFSSSRGRIISEAIQKTNNGIVKILLQSDTKAGPVDILIRTGSLEKKIISYFTPEVDRILLSPSSTTCVADGKCLIKIGLTCYDKLGSIISEGVKVNVKVKNGSILLPQDISDKEEGVQFKVVSDVSEVILQAPTKAGKETIYFSSGRTTSYLDLSFTPGSLSKINIYPTSLTIPAGKSYRFRVEGEDAFGNIIPDISFSYKIIGDGNITQQAEFSSTKVGTGKIIAYHKDVFGFADFEIVPDKPASIFLTASQEIVLAGDKVIIYLSAKDRYQNPVRNIEFNVKELTFGSKSSKAKVEVDSNGQGSFEFTTSTAAGINTGLVSYEDVSGIINIIGKPHKAAFIYLSSSPTVYTPNSTVTISAKVVDAYQNLVEDKTSVAFSTTGGEFRGGTPVFVGETIGGKVSIDLSIISPPSEITITASADNVVQQLTLKPATSIPISGPVEQLMPRDKMPEKIVVQEERIIDKLVFKDADIKVVLQALSEKGGLNIVADEKVTGQVSMSLMNIPVLEALELILQTKGYGYRKVGNSIIVYGVESPRPLLATEVIKIKSADASDIQALAKDLIKEGNVLVDKRTNSLIVSAELASLDEIRKLILAIDYPIEGVEGGGIATSVFRLHYADALSVMAILQNMGFGRAQGTNIQIYNQPSYGTSSASGNLIIVREAPDNLSKIRKVIQDIDKPPIQVRCEVRIEEINRDAIKDLGIRWQDVTATTFAEKVRADGNKPLNLEAFTRSTMSISALLSTLQSQGKSKTLASPSITTVDGREARIFLGKKIPYFPKVVQNQTIQVGPQTTQPQTLSTVVEPQFKDAGITLNITPRIDKDGYVSCIIRIDVSSLVGIIQDVPMTEQRSAETIIRIKDGDTIVIGGLISNEEIERLSKFPILSDAPILGNLFRSRRKENKQTELVIFLTPYIIK